MKLLSAFTQEDNAMLFQTLYSTDTARIISTIDDNVISNLTAAINIHGLDATFIPYLYDNFIVWLAATIQVVPPFTLRYS